MKQFKIAIIIITTIFFLSGCGFKLRSATSLPPQLQQIYYQPDDPYSQFAITLKHSLRASGVTILTEPTTTAPVLKVAASYSYNTTSPASSIQARIYTLTYNATFSVISSQGKTLLSQRAVTSSRNVTLQPGEVFDVTPQVETVKQEMQQDLTRKVMDILCAKNTQNLNI